ncbi:MAG TPA: hypothetical protein VGH02_12160 [Rhizomicrobium sp.]|jgi:hypothetical protein
MSTSAKKPAFRVVSVYKRDGKESFAEIGAAWATAKGGFSLRLNAHPIGDTVLLRPYADKAEPAEQA